MPTLVGQLRESIWDLLYYNPIGIVAGFAYPTGTFDDPFAAREAVAAITVRSPVSAMALCSTAVPNPGSWLRNIAFGAGPDYHPASFYVAAFFRWSHRA